MNKHTLYLVGGALLTSTALTTGANAATFKTSNGATGALPAAYVAKPVATQVFSATTTTANLVTLGAGGTTAANDIFIDLPPLFVTFDLKVDISTATAAFSTATAPTVVFYGQSTSGTITSILTSSVSGCLVQASSDRISVLGCNPSSAGANSKIDAVAIRGVQYTSAAALRTVGTSITLSGATFQANSASTFEGITPAVVVTSKSAVFSASVTPGSTAVIDNNATPLFASLVSSGITTSTTAVLGSVTFSVTSAVGTDLSNVFGSYVSLASQTEVKVTHSVLTDSALTQIVFGGQTRTSSDFVSGSVTFNVPAASVLTDPIVVTFASGTAPISETTGSPTATVTPTAGGLAIAAIPAFTGSLAKLSRGGLSVELNTILPSAMKASYISFLRIANQSSVAATATITVRNDATGLTVGTFVTDSIPTGGVAQINSVDIDAKLTAGGFTPLTTSSYKVTVTGSFNGYVQSLLYNVVSQVFADASGFRNGTLTTDP